MDKQSNESGNNSPLREGCEGAILPIHKDDAAVFGHTPVINVISATSLLGSLCFRKEKMNLTENQPGGLSLAQCHKYWCDSDPGGWAHFPATCLPQLKSQEETPSVPQCPNSDGNPIRINKLIY